MAIARNTWYNIYMNNYDLHIEPSDIGQFLASGNTYYEIPDFQRPYSWDLEDAKLFMEDIENTMATENSEHYFGSVIWMPEGSFKRIIIDGQQRITTVTLMLTAIYHLAKKDESKLKQMSHDSFSNMFLSNPENLKYGRPETHVKLRTVTVDHEIFEKIYNQVELSEQEKVSRLNIVYQYFYDYLSGKDSLDDYYEVLGKFKIAHISLGMRDDPQRIFESINSTGKPLKDGDKIRNFALMLKNENLRNIVYNDYWKKIEKSLVTIKSDDNLSDFFRTFLISVLQRDVKLNEVYSEFKKYFGFELGKVYEEQEIRMFYNRLVNYLNHYLFLKFGNDPDGRYNSVREQAFRLRYLRIEIPFPFLMRILDRYLDGEMDEVETKQIFAIVETYLVRRILMGQYTSSLNKIFYPLYKNIERHIKKADSAPKCIDVLSYILLHQEGNTALPDDKEVSNGIRRVEFYRLRGWVRTFVLFSINSLSKDSLSLEQYVNGSKHFTIEHVMPQTLSKEWRKMLGEEHQRIYDTYIHTLPNLTLTGYNSEYSNLPFSGVPGKDKKTLTDEDGSLIGLDSSSIWMNHWFKDKTIWNEEAIVERAKWYEKQIFRIWPMPKTAYEAPFEGDIVDLVDAGNLTNRIIVSFTAFGDEYSVAQWSDAYYEIMNIIFDKYPVLYEKYLDDPMLQKAISSSNEGPFSRELGGNGHYYISTNTSTNHKIRILQAVLGLLSDEDVDDLDIKLYLKAEKEA